MGRRLTRDEVVEKAVRIHGNAYDYSLIKDEDYKNNKTKVQIKCNTCGNVFWQAMNEHFRGYGCSHCAGNLRKDNDTFIEESIKVHGDKYLYPKVKYVNNHTPVTITCKIHGDFEQLPKNHLKGEGCLKCSEEKVTLKHIESNDNSPVMSKRQLEGLLVEKYDGHNIDVQFDSKAVGRFRLNRNVKAKCCKHDYEWDTTVRGLLDHSECIYCQEEDRINEAIGEKMIELCPSSYGMVKQQIQYFEHSCALYFKDDNQELDEFISERLAVYKRVLGAVYPKFDLDKVFIDCNNHRMLCIYCEEHGWFEAPIWDFFGMMEKYSEFCPVCTKIKNQKKDY